MENFLEMAGWLENNSAAERRLFQQVEFRESVESTNDSLKPYIGTRVPRVLWADRQLAGKGRYGRHWYSPAGQGLYISFLFFPGWGEEKASYLNILSSLAVLDLIRRVGGAELSLALKPPNDVLIGGRKVCGILAEIGTEKQRVQWAIVGIGVNLFQDEFPPDIAASATSLRLEGIQISNPDHFREALISSFESTCLSLCSGQWAELESRYQRESL